MWYPQDFAFGNWEKEVRWVWAVSSWLNTLTHAPCRGVWALPPMPHLSWIGAFGAAMTCRWSPVGGVASGIADYFNVDVVFADFESRIIDYDCDCPAAARFDGMCKHCVALTVAYFAQPKSFEEIGDVRAAVSPGRTTSEALAQCLGGSIRRDARARRRTRRGRSCGHRASRPCILPTTGASGRWI